MPFPYICLRRREIAGMFETKNVERVACLRESVGKDTNISEEHQDIEKNITYCQYMKYIAAELSNLIRKFLIFSYEVFRKIKYLKKNFLGIKEIKK